MTYCFAWKSNNEVYIIADSLTSSKSEASFENESPFSTMGETYGEYNSNFIGETDTKIYIKNNIVIAFSGKVNTFEEVKRILDLIEDALSPEQTMNSLKDVIGEAELIIGVKNKENNKLYHLKKLGYTEIIENIAIGSGSKIKELNNLMKEFSVTDPDPDPDYDPRKKLSAATVYMQMLSLKNNYLDYGVGGTYCGVCIHNEIEWNDDLLYFIYDENFEDKKLINVIIRKNTLITGSDFTGLTKLFFYKHSDENEPRKMHRFIHKSITYYVPRYIVFYSFELNNVYFCDINNQTQTGLVRMFQRRGKEAAKTEFFTTPFLTKNFLLSNKNEEKMIIPFHYLETHPVKPVSRNELIENVENYWDVDYENDNYDYPLENIRIPIEISDIFKSELSDYESIIIVNSIYLESKIIELSNFYNGLNVSFDFSQILNGLCKRMEQDLGIANFKILLFSDKNEVFYNEIDNIEVYLNQKKCNYKEFTEALLLNYYKDDRYYHLDKIVIIDDSSHFNDVFEILPDYNRYLEEADIFMIKNQNGESQVLFSPYYYVSDTIISIIVGLTPEALGLWDPSEMTTEEKESMAEYLNSKI